MGSVPFAFSVHHFINSVGADAGFASIIGLAILVLLYFSQARETASLREQAFESAQRVQDLEASIAELARQGAAAPQPVGAAATSRPAAAAARPVAAAAAAAASRGVARPPIPASAQAVAPAAPAGVAAPALTAATRLIPVGGGGGAPAAPVPVAAGAAPPLAEQTAIGALPPATAAAGANGTGEHPAVASASAPPPRVQIRPGAAPGSAPRRPSPLSPPRSRAPQRGGRAGRRFALLLAALLVVGAVAVLLIVTSSGGTSPSTSPSTPTTNAPATHHKQAQAPVNPANVTVAVLNGTATSGLAHRVATRLVGVGYKEGTLGNTADQTRTATVVAYLPGHRRDALAVASSLKLGSASVQPVDQSTQAIACPPPTPCAATVVVTVGSDLAAQ